MEEIYIACDVEADGPYPGDYSMISLGMSVVGHPEDTFYIEIRPISTNFIQEAMNVNGLDRNKLMIEGNHPHHAMDKAFKWVDNMGKKYNSRPVFLAGPAVWDGMFIHWYFMKFLQKSPFGKTGSGVDLRSYWMGKQNITWNKSGKRDIAKHLGDVKLPHTHNAGDDAKELAAYFEKILKDQGQLL